MMLSQLLRRAEAVSRGAVWFGGALAIASVLLISFDVIARKLFSFTVGGADELSSYAFAIGTSWSLAFVTLQRANVRVDVIYQHLPVRLSAVIDWLALASLGVFMTVLTRYVYDMVETSWIQNSAANTPLGTPLWIPQGLWLLGLAWMCVTVALMLLRASTALVTGDLVTVKEIGGVRSSQEEAEDEAAAGERLLMEERA
jgi:TRAP-type C4-dicarboxylate transport system permease small subunit